MAATGCDADLESIGITCKGEKQAGGVNKFLWVGKIDQFDYTLDANGYVNAITMLADGSSVDYQLITITGKKNTHSGTFEGVDGTNVNTVTHNALLKIFATTPKESEAITNLFKAEDLCVFFRTENDDIVIYGLKKGLSGTALTGGTGILLQDDTGITLTLSGEQLGLPDWFATGNGINADVVYLNARSKAVTA